MLCALYTQTYFSNYKILTDKFSPGNEEETVTFEVNAFVCLVIERG